MTAPDPASLLARARAGDDAAFEEAVGPHRRELLTHCYRMLGSLQDAEDALQESLLAAWRALGDFEERSSLRTWLYAVTTNRCLNVRRATQRRREQEWAVPGVTPPEPSHRGEVVWLEPVPDRLLDREAPESPEARYERGESLTLAFVTALQTLPPRQVAVLVLRDVLGFPSADVAHMLGTTVDSVASALKRARAGLRTHHGPGLPGDRPGPRPGSPEEVAVTERFVRAYEQADVPAIVALLTDDVFMSMPPMTLEYRGRDLAGEFVALFFAAGRRYRMVATRANGQPAVGMYLLQDDGSARASGLLVLGLRGTRINRLTRFDPATLAPFGLPGQLPAAQPAGGGPGVSS